MPGFFITNMPTADYQIKNVYPQKSVDGCIQYEEITVQRAVLDSFIDDKLFIDIEKYLIVTDGIIINSDKLKSVYHTNILVEAILQILDSGQDIYKKIGHLASGAIYEKQTKTWTIFTNPTGDRAVFYYFNEKTDEYIIGSQLDYLTKFMKQNQIARNPDYHGLSCLLDFGTFTDESTGIKNIKRLYPGDFLIINSKGMSVNTYSNMSDYSPTEKSLEEAIEELDQAFLDSMKRLIQKNKEYNLKIIADLSGGLDSRIICYALKRLGYEEGILLSYGQSTSFDVKTAHQVALNLNMDWYFKAMDHPKFIADIDNLLQLNSGVNYYYHITGGKDFLELLDHDICGMELTGFLGDIYENSMLTKNGLDKPDAFFERFKSSSFIEIDQTLSYSLQINRFNNNDLFWFYTRGIMFGLGQFLIRQNFVEPVTPFGDPAFLKAYYEIPWEMRVKEKVLTNWFIRKYPDAAKLPYAATGLSIINERSLIKRIYSNLYYKKNRLIESLGKPYPNTMNPFDFWMKEYPDLSKFMDDYFHDNLERVKEDCQLKKRLSSIYELRTDFMSRAIVINILGYYKNFIN